MRATKFLLPLLFLIAVMGTGCVSKKKFSEMENLKNHVQDMLDEKNQALKDCNTEKDSLNQLVKSLEDEKYRLQADTARLAKDRNQVREQMRDLKNRCDQMSDNYENLKSQSSKKVQDLIDQLERLQDDLAARQARLDEVERRLNERDSVMNALRQKVADALLGFRDQGLTVEIKDGKVYVSLSNKLLFASGSTKLDKNGQQALKDLAGVLKDQKDLTIMVEGHTDNVKVTNLGDIKDNWDLSVMRSTEVVRVLVAEGVEPTRIIPSGRGETLPKASGDTPEARASNRRTEIILSPKLDALYELINQSR
jgi:chemotaxis protein MotB